MSVRRRVEVLRKDPKRQMSIEKTLVNRSTVGPFELIGGLVVRKSN